MSRSNASSKQSGYVLNLLLFFVLIVSAAVVFLGSQGVFDRLRLSPAPTTTSLSIENIPVHVQVPYAAPADGYHALVVLHGYGGTGEPMMQTFAGVAQDAGVLLIAPTFGEYPPDYAVTVGRLRLVLERLAKTYPIRDNRVVIYGMSGGGGVASQFLRTHPQLTAGAVLSAATELVRPGSRDIPTHILYGQNDGLWPFNQSMANNLQSEGYAVNLEIVPNAGHEMTNRDLEATRAMLETAFST